MKVTEEELDFGMLVVLLLPILLVMVALFVNTIRVLNQIRHSLSRSSTSSESLEFFSDPLYEAQMDSRALMTLSPNQQEVYFQAKEYVKLNGYQKGEIPPWMTNAIEERGVDAWNFLSRDGITDQDIDIDSRSPVELEIRNKTELKFNLNPHQSIWDRDVPPTLTIQTNFPIPNKGKTSTQDTFYIEYKVFSLPQPDNVVLSLGLATYPHPNFVLPGRFPHSIGYDSTGFRRCNEPFGSGTDSNDPLLSSSSAISGSASASGATSSIDSHLHLQPLLKDPLVLENDVTAPFPKMEQGDVIGVGLRLRTKSVFFTRNGKRISEAQIGGHKRFPKDVLIYPTLGLAYLNSSDEIKVEVNLGQAGYVFIEANVKKWGLGNLNGSQPPPPKYERWNNDVILETTDNEGPPRFDQFAEDEDEENDEDDEDDDNNQGNDIGAELHSVLDINMNDAFHNLNLNSNDNQSSNSADNLTLDTLLPNYEELVEDDIKQAMCDRL